MNPPICRCKKLSELTKSEKIRLSTTEIAKLVRQQLKEEFPTCKFSVTSEYYSMGSALHVSLMKADRKIVKDFDKLSEFTIFDYTERDNRYTVEALKNLQEEKYHQLSSNGFYHHQEYDAKHWCNGVFLTYQGYMLLKRVYQITAQYNFDDSDSMTDYYCVNFSLHMNLGKWDKPFIDGVGFINDPILFKRVEDRDQQVKLGFEKQKQEEKIREIERAQRVKENENKPHIPTTATHVIDGSRLRPLTVEERETGQPKDKLEKKWFNGLVDWKKFVLEL